MTALSCNSHPMVLWRRLRYTTALSGAWPAAGDLEGIGVSSGLLELWLPMNLACLAMLESQFGAHKSEAALSGDGSFVHIQAGDS